METTLLTAGLACLIAAVIGGGLKAFNIEIPVLTTWPRQIALFALGLVLCFIAFDIRPIRPRQPPPSPAAKQELAIHYAQRGGPFVELDPADKKHPQKGYWWHAMDVRVENRCAEAIHIDPVKFRLYLSRTASVDGAASFSPETITAYSRRLPGGWLEPGKSSEGRLIFQVPDTLPNGVESNGAYHLIRTHIQSQCSAAYKPY